MRWSISKFLDSAPRPVKLLVFLVLLLLMVSVIPFFFHLVGVHCNSDLEVVKTNALSVVKNVKIAFIDRDDTFNVSNFQPETLSAFGGFTDCAVEICNVSGVIYEHNQPECQNVSTEFIYVSSIFRFTECSRCNGTKDVIANIEGIASAVGGTGTYCRGGNVERIPLEERNFIQRLSCDDESECMPPLNYYWDYTTGNYICNNPDQCGVNTTSVIRPRIDEELEEANAERMYLNDEMDFRKTVQFKCDAELSPQLTFFGIPVFDYKVWLMLYVIGAMVLFLTKIPKP